MHNHPCLRFITPQNRTKPGDHQVGKRAVELDFKNIGYSTRYTVAELINSS